MDKSPLAMLEKTCETIGLPDTPAKKSSPKSKDTSPSSNENKKNETIITKSPRLNPIPTIDKKVIIFYYLIIKNIRKIKIDFF